MNNRALRVLKDYFPLVMLRGVSSSLSLVLFLCFPLQDVYRKDCNLAVQLLQCNKSLYRAQLSEVSAAPLHALRTGALRAFCADI